MRTSQFFAAVIFAAAMLSAGQASAFSFDQLSPSKPDGSVPYTDPDGTIRYIDPDDQSLAAPLGDAQTKHSEKFGGLSGFSFSTNVSPNATGPNRFWSTESNPWK
jgi:hypothetical protein